MNATFPTQGKPWTAPLIDPLTASHVVIEASFRGARPGVVTTTNVILDTGAFRSSVSRQVVDTLGVKTSKTHRIMLVGVSGAAAPWEGAVFSQVTLGSMELTEVPFGVGSLGGISVVGNEVLARLPLEIDRDRGLVTFGAGPWTTGDSTSVIPLRPGAKRSSPQVELDLGGRRTLVILDTGAYKTGLDQKTADSMQIPIRKLYAEERYSGFHGAIKTNYRYVIPQLKLGSLSLSQVEATVIPKFRRGASLNRKAIGLLGNNVLNQFIQRIDSDRGELALRQRDVQGSTLERLRRWPSNPRCADTAGCVSVSFQRLGPSKYGVARARVRLSTSESYDDKWRFLVGFVDDEGRLLEDHPMVEVPKTNWTPDDVAVVELTAEGASLAALWPLFADKSAAQGAVLLDINPANGETRGNVFHAPILGWRLPPQTMAIGTDKHIEGEAYLEFHQRDFQRCIAACAADPRCRAHVFYEHDDGAKRCALKRRRGQVQDRPGWISGVKR